MDIVNELEKNQTVLLLVEGVRYNDVTVDIAKKLSNKSVCYVTLNKTYDHLKEHFKNHKVKLSNIVFVDAISMTIKKMPSQTENCYFVSSPGALTELAIVVDKFLRHDFD